MVDVHSRPLHIYWNRAEKIYSTLKQGYSPEPADVAFIDWSSLFEDLKHEKNEVKRQQQLGRLIPQPSFINDYSNKTKDSYALVGNDEDEDDEDDPNHDPEMLKKARRVCYRFRVLFWCASKIPEINLKILNVLAESLVIEWPFELDKGNNRFWDKAPLFINTADSTRTSSTKTGKNKEKEKNDEKKTKRPTYQLRFLALEGLWNLDQHDWIYVEVHHSLHEKFEDSCPSDPTKNAIIGKIFDLKRKMGHEYYMLPTPGPNLKGLEKTILRKIYRGRNEKTAIPINNLEIIYSGTEKLLGRHRHFVIRSHILISTGWGNLQISPDDTYPSHCFNLYYELFELQRASDAFNPFVYPYPMTVESLPFILQKNVSKQLFDHYFDAAWKVFNDYHHPGKYRPIKEKDDVEQKTKSKKGKRKAEPEQIEETQELETYNAAKVELGQVLVWLNGIIAWMCSKWCRLSDSKEESHLRRLLLFKRVCRVAFDTNSNWFEQADRIEALLFDTIVTREKDRVTRDRWAMVMKKKLVSHPLSSNVDTLLIEKADLSDERCVIGDDFMMINPDGKEKCLHKLQICKPAPSLIEWILHVGKNVEDQNLSLGTNRPDQGRSALDFYNEKYLTIRSPERCEKIARDYNETEDNPPPAMILSFDTENLDHLHITFTDKNPENEYYSGPAGIASIGQLKKHVKAGKGFEEAKGLRVYLSQGNLAYYCRIIQIQLQEINGKKSDQFYPCYIFGNDIPLEKRDESHYIFKTRPQIITRRLEIDPQFGRTRMAKRQWVYAGNAVPEAELSRILMLMEISEKQEPEHIREKEYNGVPTKKSNQKREPESPSTPSTSQLPSIISLQNSNSESDCETLSNSVVHSNPSSVCTERPDRKRAPWKNWIDYLHANDMDFSDSNHLGVHHFADGMYGYHQMHHQQASSSHHPENAHQNYQEQQNDAPGSYRDRSRTSSVEFPSIHSQCSSARDDISSPSWLGSPQTPIRQRLNTRESEDDQQYAQMNVNTWLGKF